MFSVSTAVVKWWYNGFLGSLLTPENIATMNACTSCIECEFPANWGKYQRISVSGLATFFSNKSYLLRKSMMDTLPKIILLTMASKMSRASSSLFVFRSSSNTWSNSEEETRKSIDVTESKHWNHFCRWDLCPPTSTKRKGILLMVMTNSVMPLVAFRQCRMSLLVGMYSGLDILSKLFRKYSTESLCNKNMIGLKNRTSHIFSEMKNFNH